MNSVQVIGIIAGGCTSISMLPQLIKTIKEKKDGDISYFMLVILLTGIGLWIWYGLLKEDYPIIITNAISFLLNSLIIFFNLYYRKKRQHIIQKRQQILLPLFPPPNNYEPNLITRILDHKIVCLHFNFRNGNYKSKIPSGKCCTG